MSSANKFAVAGFGESQQQLRGYVFMQGYLLLRQRDGGGPRQGLQCREEARACRRTCRPFQFQDPAEKAAIATLAAKWQDRQLGQEGLEKSPLFGSVVAVAL